MRYNGRRPEESSRGHTISVRLDETVEATLEDAASERGVGLSTYLRELATAEAPRIQRQRIRAQSQAVADYVASDPQARAFYEERGTPTADSRR